MQTTDTAFQDKRRYVRLDTVFPVMIRLESLDGVHFLSGWLQGFTNNISRGGICLSINNLDVSLVKVIEKRQLLVRLEIDLPIFKKPVIAQAHVSWVRNVFDTPNKYLVGLSYYKINEKQNQKIMRYVWVRKNLVPVSLLFIVLLSLGMVANGILNMRLMSGNKALVQQLVGVIQDSRIAKEKISSVARERQDLEIKVQELNLLIAQEKLKRSLSEQQDEKLTDYGKKLNESNVVIQNLASELERLKEQLLMAKRQESFAIEEAAVIDKKKAVLEKANVDKMYLWLKAHQNPRTGLVMSFEGDNSLRSWAFIYDQSLAGQAFTNSSDFENTHKLFDFFKGKAKRKEGLFFNAYYVNDGEPAEYIVHSGPNIWLGIAIAQYTHKTQNRIYLSLAEEIAAGVIALQDKEGGIRGGLDVAWYSTEHNLDAYAFFNMLHKITGKAKYAEAADKVLEWLKEHTYDETDIPIKRGKGDSTIATDTYAWSIAAIGPEKLERIGMNPDRIMEFAEANCSVEVDYLRPEGKTVKIKGFDFASKRHLGRGGIVSSEWTAQMVISFKIMESFYSRKGMSSKAHGYRVKAEEYLASLGKMIISSPSPSGQGESCLPYATGDFVDTGHGWFTPKGNSTGSLAGTAYTFFAYSNYNPLELK